MRPQTELALLLACWPVLLAGQGRDVDVVYGQWYQGNRATTYELRTDAPFAAGGDLSHGFALQVLVHDSLGRRRAFYGAGWELHALRRRATLGPYVIAGAAFTTTLTVLAVVAIARKA